MRPRAFQTVLSSFDVAGSESETMALFQMQVETTHPILFLSDSSAIGSSLPDTGTTFATATDNCLAFYVLAYVDGASLVTISNEESTAHQEPLFEGFINSPSGILTLSDSRNFRYLNVPVQEGRVGVRVWAEHHQTPDWVWLQVSAIRPI
jgi:hypothetical protein